MLYGKSDGRLVEVENLEIILVAIALAGLCLAWQTNKNTSPVPALPQIPPIPFPLSHSIPLRDVSSSLIPVVGTKISGISIISNQECFVQIFDDIPSNVTLGTTNPVLEFSVLGDQSDFPLSTPVQILHGILVASTTTEKGSVGSSPGVQVFVRT